MNLDFNANYKPNNFEIQVLMRGMQQYFKYPERSIDRNNISFQISNFLKTNYPHWTQRNVRLYFNNNRNKPKYLNYKKENDDLDQEAVDNKDTIIYGKTQQLLDKNEKKCMSAFLSQSFEYYADQTNKLAIGETISIQKDNLNKINAEINNFFSREKIIFEYNSENFSEESNNIKAQHVREIKTKYKRKNIKKGNFLQNAKLNHSIISKSLVKSNQNEICEMESVPTIQEQITKVVFKNIKKNFKRLPNGRRYPDEVIDFFFLIKFGPNSYENLRYAFPILCIKTLYKRRSDEIKGINDEIFEEGNSLHLINNGLGCQNECEEKFKVILSIDAIKIALFQKVDTKKNIFILFIIPLISLKKPFTFYVNNKRTNKRFI